ncbi:11-beta-hydroxysteroid dehydrogenase 1 [Erythrolamprus reginae]|uniref:11-beta-hydroxysteroid dehydrogenase 1 n=1 Tax=Erythrolamprus reginae TaxID=121349 RepID=UPI00396CA9CE
MNLRQKILIPLVGMVLAIYFYSGKEEFKPEMLKGKRVIVTGASTGIGEQIAYHLAQMGSHLLITARTEAKLQQVVAHCLELGAASARYINGSMEDMKFAQAVVKRAEELWGSLDMLILNHIGKAYFHYFNGDIEHVEKLLSTNFLSYITMTVSALPMLKDSGGNIVVVSSLAGKIGFPLSAPYSATKFALGGFFNALRQEFVMQNIDVSITLCILGLINTEAAMNMTSGTVSIPPAPKEECALEIIKGGILRQREIYYKYIFTKIPALLRDWAPELMDYFIRRAYNVDNLTQD